MDLSLEVGRDIRGIRKALERIADAMELAVAAPSPAPTTGCLHPADRRVDFGQTNGVDDWQCGACGYRTVAPATEGEGVRG